MKLKLIFGLSLLALTSAKADFPNGVTAATGDFQTITVHQNLLFSQTNLIPANAVYTNFTAGDINWGSNAVGSGNLGYAVYAVSVNTNYLYQFTPGTNSVETTNSAQSFLSDYNAANDGWFVPSSPINPFYPISNILYISSFQTNTGSVSAQLSLASSYSGTFNGQFDGTFTSPNIGGFVGDASGLTGVILPQGTTTNSFGLASQNSYVLPSPPIMLSDYWDTSGVENSSWLSNAIAIHKANGIQAAYGSNAYIYMDANIFTNRDGSGNFQLNGSYTNSSGVRYSVKNISDYVHSQGFLFAVTIQSVVQILTPPNTLSSSGRPQTSNDVFFLYSSGVDFIKYAGTGGAAQQQIAAQNIAEATRYLPIVTGTDVDPTLWSPYKSGAEFSNTNYLGNAIYFMPQYFYSCYNYTIAGSLFWDGTMSGLLSTLGKVYYPYTISQGRYNNCLGSVFSNNGGSIKTNITQVGLSFCAQTVSPITISSNITAAQIVMLTNVTFKSILQDPLALPGKWVANSNLVQVWSRPLSGGKYFVTLLNPDSGGPTTTNVTVVISSLGSFNSANFYDVFSGTNVGIFNGAMNYIVQATNCASFIVTPTTLFPLVNQGTTNASALTSFTASFPSAFVDTNYTATAIGNGFALAASFVSAKTTTNCVFNMTVATGLIDWIATHK